MNSIMYPGPGFEQQVAQAVDLPLSVQFSGQIAASEAGKLAGTFRKSGRIADVILSVGASGKDDSNDLFLEANVLINGITCLTTKPKVAHVSGEASQNKTTAMSGDGITQAVMGSDNAYSPGDAIQVNWELTRTSSPTTEMANASLIIIPKPG